MRYYRAFLIKLDLPSILHQAPCIISQQYIVLSQSKVPVSRDHFGTSTTKNVINLSKPETKNNSQPSNHKMHTSYAKVLK